MLNVIPVPALSDNYIWLLNNEHGDQVAIVDPGEAIPVLRKVKEDNLKPIAILITHHHWDHVNGIDELLENYSIPVYGPASEQVKHRTHALKQGDRVDLPELELTIDIYDVPGHTAGAIAYFGRNILFSGDTLFTAGCGKLFEGTPAQMHDSLSKLAALPDETLLYCGHEYTLNNLAFALAVEPYNTSIPARLNEVKQLREQGLPSVPSPMKMEKETNPFLRTQHKAVIEAASQYAGKQLTQGAEVLAAIRHWKDHFSG
ncbi:MAG: hydroxyacylglutathione hydrolase [Gammaproteobacteria bacterium]|jgi:hydroxyacylglutathione hydrolase